jgi:hypothetical protein
MERFEKPANDVEARHELSVCLREDNLARNLRTMADRVYADLRAGAESDSEGNHILLKAPENYVLLMSQLGTPIKIDEILPDGTTIPIDPRLDGDKYIRATSVVWGDIMCFIGSSLRLDNQDRMWLYDEPNNFRATHEGQENISVVSLDSLHSEYHP